jgi:hypothetical protein
MKKIFPIILLFCSVTAAQSYQDSVSRIEDDFKSFNYKEVIAGSSELLEQDTLSADLKIRLYMMKGISHFVILEDTLAKYSFLEILRLDPGFTPDSSTTSPKIIDFFDEIRENYAWYYNPPVMVQLPVDSVELLSPAESFRQYKEKMRVSVIRSLLFPGLGHLYLNNNIGYYLAIPAGISFLSSVYFLIDTENKRKDYLNAQEPSLIDSRYKSYNSSYKVRNTSILIFSAVWLFSQFDILFTDYIEPYHPGYLAGETGITISLNFNANIFRSYAK